MAVKTVAKTGLYSASDTWSPAGKPAANDSILFDADYTLTLDESTASLDWITHPIGTINVNGYTITSAVYQGTGAGAHTFTGTGKYVCVTGSLTVGTGLIWSFTGDIDLVYAGAAARTYNWGTSRTFSNNITVYAGGAGACYLACTTYVRFTGQVTINGPKQVQKTSNATYIFDKPPIFNTASEAAITTASSTAGSPAILCCLQGGNIPCDWLLLGASSWQVSNLVGNPGFEVAGGGGADVLALWTEINSNGSIARDTGVYRSGVASVKLTDGATDNTYIYNSTGAVIPGKAYTLAFWTQGDGTNAGRYLVKDITNDATIIANVTTGVTVAEWTQVVVSFVAPAGCYLVRVYPRSPIPNGAFAYFDDVSVKLSTVDNWYAGEHSELAGGGAIPDGYLGWFAGAAPAAGAVHIGRRSGIGGVMLGGRH